MYLSTSLSLSLSLSISLYRSVATEPRRIRDVYPGVDFVPEGGAADVD